MNLCSLIPDTVLTDAIMSGEPLTISAWVKGNRIVNEVALWKRRLTETERVELQVNNNEHDGWRLLIYDYDPKRGRKYKIIRH